MFFFLDSADVDEIRELNETGLIHGVTTNPSLIAGSGRDLKQVIAEICAIVEGPVSAEVTATDFTTMMREAEVLRGIAENIAVKVPLTVDGLKACRALAAEGAQVNVTLCFSANQALLAAAAGATYISPFVGRLDDIGADGIELLKDIRTVYANIPDCETMILAASIRTPAHVFHAAKVGADIVTLPGKIFRQLYQHPLTDRGLEAFLADWKKTGQKIVA